MPPSDNRRSRVLLAMLIVPCVACDFLMAPVLAALERSTPSFSNISLIFAITGCVLAQGNLLAAWLAWSDRPFADRLVRHWIVAAVLYLIWILGLALSRFTLDNPDQFAEGSSIIGLSVPLVSLGAQFPLWIARQMFGWRLNRGEPAADAPLSIRHLMAATVLVALSLALARLTPIPDAEEQVIVCTAMFVAATLVSSMALLPGAALLRIQPFRRGLLFAGLYALSWVGLVWLVVLIVRRQGYFALPPVELFVGLSCSILSFATTVMLAAAAAHALGYRLVSGRRLRR